MKTKRIMRKWSIIRDLTSNRNSSVRRSYLAENTKTGCTVALTVLEQSYAIERGLVQEMQEGVREYQKIEKGTGILREVDCIVSESNVYITNEYHPQAKLLTHWIAHGLAFTEEELIRIGVQLASALSRAHKAGVVFGCINPTGILYDPVSSDAYIAMLPKANRKLDTPLAVAKSLGNPQYHPPCDLLGNGISASSDVYSLLVVLYALAAGVPPYPDTSDFGEACMAVIHERHISLYSKSENLSKGFLELVDNGIVNGRRGEFLKASELDAQLSSLKPSRGMAVSLERSKSLAQKHFPLPISFYLGLISSGAQDDATKLSRMQSMVSCSLEFLGLLVMALLDNTRVECDDLYEGIEKPSLGHWMKIIREGGKNLLADTSDNVCPELATAFCSRRGKPTEAQRILNSLVAWRNRKWGHALHSDNEAFFAAVKEGEDLIEKNRSFSVVFNSLPIDMGGVTSAQAGWLFN